MFPKISGVLILLIATIQFVTCNIPCTPEMETQCTKFCKSTTYPMFCWVRRTGHPTCRQESMPKLKAGFCSYKLINDLCRPLQAMMRCQDDVLICNCKQKRGTPVDGCTVQEKENAKGCLQ